MKKLDRRYRMEIYHQKYWYIHKLEQLKYGQDMYDCHGCFYCMGIGRKWGLGYTIGDTIHILCKSYASYCRYLKRQYFKRTGIKLKSNNLNT